MIIGICTEEQFGHQDTAPAHVWDTDPMADTILADAWRNAHLRRNCHGTHKFLGGPT